MSSRSSKIISFPTTSINPARLKTAITSRWTCATPGTSPQGQRSQTATTGRRHDHTRHLPVAENKPLISGRRLDMTLLYRSTDSPVVGALP